ncbi:hypothetical protein M1U23_004556 [Escherichia coli]|nr:hypothetical protein [Escherichia coli]
MYVLYFIHTALLVYTLSVATEIIHVKRWLKRIRGRANDYAIKQINSSVVIMALSVIAIFIADISLLFTPDK